MNVTSPVLAVHGIRCRQGGLDPVQAAAALAGKWQPDLAKGFAAAGFTSPVPEIRAAYYAHLLTAAEAQGAGDDERVESLSAEEASLAWAWLRAAGVPDPADAQGPVTKPVRQGVDWLARRRRVPVSLLGRIAVAFAREVHAYLARPEWRRQARAQVAEAIGEHRPRVVLAHSLGSVVTYEALHAHPDLEVELLVTLGSPLGLPGGVFDVLEPGPVDGKGARPPGVARWVNLADPGDLVAVPQRLGDRFPVDLHDEAFIGLGKFHSLSGYLGIALTATTIAPYTGAS
ncbi:hypothetical protein [Nonomuraea sp. NPDC050786]|uniref:hypothetical protein n=1 Tax=Nonomuraea sp. NPDC050786 TaxID=3154840 RepID=UPI0033DCA972